MPILGLAWLSHCQRMCQLAVTDFLLVKADDATYVPRKNQDCGKGIVGAAAVVVSSNLQILFEKNTL